MARSMFTLREAQEQAREIGMRIRTTQHGEYRVSFGQALMDKYFPGRNPEDMACYETDRQAALDTAKAMRLNANGWNFIDGGKE